MKQKLLGRLAAAAVLLLSATTATAHDFEVNGIYYNYGSNATVSVTYKGYKPYDYKEYAGAVSIPSKVSFEGTTYSVTSIGDDAFRGCNGITSVEIPNSITTIGEMAFYDCRGLTSVEIPNSVTYISDGAFWNCEGLTSVVIPNSITSICDDVFCGCHSLTSVEIPNSVTSIGYAAFYGCGLISVEIPNSVTSIGRSAFDHCNGLKSVEIPNSVTYIGEMAFSDCNSLISVEIPNSVTSISYELFYCCKGLTSVKFPSSVSYIGTWAFRNCNSLMSITSLNPIPPTLGAYPNFSFDGVPRNYCAIYVPEGCIDAYRTAYGWNLFNNIFEITPTGVEGVATDYAKVRGENGVIRIEGAEDAVEVFNAAGVCIYSGTATEIPVPQRGIYVVKVAGRVTKIAL